MITSNILKTFVAVSLFFIISFMILGTINIIMPLLYKIILIIGLVFLGFKIYSLVDRKN